jgi:hypothetical protein
MRSAGRSASPSGTGTTASALPYPSDHKIVRQACHILAELGDDELTAA